MKSEQILIFLTFLIIKHFICDFVLQTSYQYLNKHKYGHPGGLLHATIHGFGTFCVFVWWSAPIAIVITFVDSIVHYHIDWAKAYLTRYISCNATMGRFWILFGIDQLLHYLTYIGIIAVLLTDIF
ncbi:MAG: DUF3307 domain-containing protein [Alphaproteobacteria bacterium]|nr:DUF3307 domain-containing protein [Alphaproteobacteria bacterium]